MSQRGAINLPTLVAVVLGLGFGASAYLNYSQYTRTQQDKKLLNGEITDLKYQVVQDHLGSSPAPSASPSSSPSGSPSPTPSSSATPAPTQSPAVAGASTKTIKIAGNIHDGPSKGSKTLVPYSSVAVGSSVTIMGDPTGGYQQITYNGTTGYIESADLQ
jgi:hypothetical protein